MTDKETFVDQVRQLKNSMYSLAFSIVKNDADAAEIVSESVFRAYKSLNSLKNNDFFKIWILKIVHNTAVEFVRKNSKQISLNDIEIISDDNKNNIIVSLSLKNAIETLKQPYKTVIVLYYYEDLSISQIAKITGSAPVTVKKQLSRARKQLRELLKEDFRDE